MRRALLTLQIFSCRVQLWQSIFVVALVLQINTVAVFELIIHRKLLIEHVRMLIIILHYI